MDDAKPKGDALEQLAKDAAAGAQFEFNPAAWDAMEQKLDAPKRGFFWWRLGGGLGMLAILLFFIFKPFGGPTDILNENKTQGVENTTKAEKADPSNASENNNAASKPQATDETSSNGTDSARETNDKSQASAENSTQQENQESNTNSQTLSATNSEQTNASARAEADAKPVRRRSVNAAVSGDEKEGKLVDNQSDKQNVFIAKTEANNEKSEKTDDASQVNYFELAQPNTPNDSIGVREADLYEASFETITPEWFPPKYLFDLSLKPMTLDSGNYRTPEVDSLQPFKRWSFGVLVSFDLSATGLDGFTDPGLMVGLQAEYNVSRKWSIQSGVSYSVKKYRALGTEYNTSAWPGGRADNLVAAEARCLVIDIPINLRRYFEGKQGNRWFVNTGVSTYLMLREDYDYEYTRVVPGWAPTGQVRGENNHVFGIANVSFGYETTLNKKFRIAVEPFMKLPLTGIGQGEVKFLSFGTNLVLKLK